MDLVQFPMPSAVVVPREVLPPRNSSTVLFASAVPVKVGVVTLVMLSVSEDPESLAAVMSGVDGAAGAVLSTVKVAPLVGVEVITLPARSVPVLSDTVAVPSP